MTLRSSPMTSEMASVRHAARDAGRQPSALDRRQVLAHRVQRVDVGAGAQQQSRRRALVLEVECLSPVQPSAPMRRLTAARAVARRRAAHRAEPGLAPGGLAAGAGFRMFAMMKTSGGVDGNGNRTDRPARRECSRRVPPRGARHRRRRLAGRDDPRASGRRASRIERARGQSVRDRPHRYRPVTIARRSCRRLSSECVSACAWDRTRQRARSRRRFS